MAAPAAFVVGPVGLLVVAPMGQADSRGAVEAAAAPGAHHEVPQGAATEAEAREVAMMGKAATAAVAAEEVKVEPRAEEEERGAALAEGAARR